MSTRGPAFAEDVAMLCNCLPVGRWLPSCGQVQGQQQQGVRSQRVSGLKRTAGQTAATLADRPRAAHGLALIQFFCNAYLDGEMEGSPPRHTPYLTDLRRRTQENPAPLSTSFLGEDEENLSNVLEDPHSSSESRRASSPTALQHSTFQAVFFVLRRLWHAT